MLRKGLSVAFIPAAAEAAEAPFGASMIASTFPPAAGGDAGLASSPVKEASASAASAGVWQRRAGSFAIILAATAASPAGISAAPR